MGACTSVQIHCVEEVVNFCPDRSQDCQPSSSVKKHCSSVVQPAATNCPGTVASCLISATSTPQSTHSILLPNFIYASRKEEEEDAKDKEADDVAWAPVGVVPVTKITLPSFASCSPRGPSLSLLPPLVRPRLFPRECIPMPIVVSNNYTAEYSVEMSEVNDEEEDGVGGDHETAENSLSETDEEKEEEKDEEVELGQDSPVVGEVMHADGSSSDFQLYNTMFKQFRLELCKESTAGFSRSIFRGSRSHDDGNNQSSFQQSHQDIHQSTHAQSILEFMRQGCAHI